MEIAFVVDMRDARRKFVLGFVLDLAWLVGTRRHNSRPLFSISTQGDPICGADQGVPAPAGMGLGAGESSQWRLSSLAYDFC